MTTTIEAIRDLLVVDSTLDTLVDGKIYASHAPQGTVAPFVVMRVISDVPENTLTGTSVGRLSGTRLQIDSYAKRYLDAHAVADAVDAVVSALDGPRLAAQRIDGRDGFDDADQLHNASADFAVWR